MPALLILIFVVMRLAGQEPQEVSNPRTSPADVAMGAKTFRSHCSPCHGIYGEGGRGPNLASGRFYHGSSDSSLLKNISQGIPGTEMPGLFYSSDRIWQVVTYLRSLNSGSEPHGNAKRGAAIFQSLGCAQCHRVKGEGGGLGPDLTNIGAERSAQYLRESVLNPNAYVADRYRVVSFKNDAGEEYAGFLMNEDTYSVETIDFHQQLHSFAKASLKDYRVQKVSKMPSYAEKLSSGQVDDLVTFLWSLRKEADRP